MSSKVRGASKAECERLREICTRAREAAFAELGSTVELTEDEWPDEPTGVLRIRIDAHRKRLESASKEPQ